MSDNPSKTAELSVEALDALLPLMIRHLPVGILLVNGEGHITLANPKLENVFGYTQQELIGQPIEMLLPKRFHPLHSSHRAGFMKHPEARPMGAGRELFARHKDGREISVEIGLVPIPTPDGIHVLATLIDVTEKKRLEQDLLHAVEVEQKRIGQDLHDNLGQQLLAISFLCNVFRKKLAAGSVPDVSEAANIEELLNEAKVTLRRLSRGLYSTDLETRGLGPSLKDLTEQVSDMSGMNCVFEGEASLQIPNRAVSENLYRLAQEALNNAMKHSFAKKIVVSLNRTGSHVVLEIKDDGVGLPEISPQNSGLGMRTMRYRASAIGAVFQTERQASGGTAVRCSVDVQA